MTRFDYIIIGAGAAGLQMAIGLARDRYFSDHQILLIEKEKKETNDRTWCFWEKGSGKWDHLISHQWDQILIAGSDLVLQAPITPYSYKMIRGIDFYTDTLNQLKNNDQFTLLTAEVIHVDKATGHVETTSGNFDASYVFDSRPSPGMFKGVRPYRFLKQHFIGWVVKTSRPVFDPEIAHFMDFRIKQQQSTRFIYVLPFTADRALVEYTLFSEKELETAAYEKGITEYLKTQYGVVDFTILEKESGVIPMTNFPLEKNAIGNYLPIGSAGGWTKASTGFTFKLTEQKVAHLLRQLKQGRVDSRALVNQRFRFYDTILLEILYRHNYLGSFVFTELFRRNNVHALLKFLNEETSIWQDLNIILHSPFKVFFRALIDHLRNRLSAK